MTQIVSSISGIEIYAPSAGNAPTNSSEVSAIASAYQVVSATATQLYAGTSFLTSVNSTPVSASRAGNAANASLATSAWYDGTGRLISALPDKAAVSSIASGYVTGVSATVANNSASWGGGGGSVVSPSGTIFVSGSNIEGTNSAAILQQTAAGFTQYLEKTYFLNEIAPYLQEITYNHVDDTGANLLMEFQETAHDLPITILISGRDSAYLEQSASSFISVGENSASIPLGSIVQGISASASEHLHFPGGFQDFTAEKAGESGIVGVGELAWNSALTGVSSTVASHSAAWEQGGVPASTVSSIASSYASSAVSGVESAVSANSATWGQGGLVTSTASAAASAYTSTSTSVSSFTGISSVNGSALLARNILPDAQQANGNAHFHFMPTASPWGSTEYTGVLSPLQYATGAALAMKQTNNYGAYYKGNEWFISDVGSNTAANGVVRAELHRTRGIHLYGSSLNSATGFHLNGSGVDGKSGGSAWQYGPTEYNMLTSVNDTVSSNSASWGGFDSATCSAIASSYAQDVSAAVSGTVDTVSSQSAIWGASALQIAAGPGIKLTKSGSVLFVENDVTVLYEAESVTNNTAGQVFTMSESVLNFRRLRITCENMEFPTRPFTQEYPVFNSSSTFVSPWQNAGTPPSLNIPYSQYSINGDGNLVCDKRGLLYGSLSNPQHTDGASRGYCLMKVEGLDKINAE